MKTIYRIILFIYIITLLYISFVSFRYHIFISLLLLIPLYLIHEDLYKIEYILYIYMSQVLGTTCQFYTLPYYDKIMHFLSGMIFVLISFIILQKYMFDKKILYLFMNTIEMSVAFLWEVFEYSGLIFFHFDAMHHYTSGVHDTMQDMLISLFGGLIMTYIIDRYPSYIHSLYKQPQDNLGGVSQQQHI